MKTHVDNVYTWITIYHNLITYSIRVRKFWVVVWRVMVAKTATKMIMLKINPTRSYHTKINTIACIKYILFHPMYSYNQKIHYHNVIQHKNLIIYKFQRKTTHNYTPVFTALNTDNYIVYNIYIHTYETERMFIVCRWYYASDIIIYCRWNTIKTIIYICIWFWTSEILNI